MVKYNRKVKLDQNPRKPIVLVVSFMDGALSGVGARKTGSGTNRERVFRHPVSGGENRWLYVTG